MITPVFDEIPAYEQAFSPILLFFQHPRFAGRNIRLSRSKIALA
jgi:hypothetical protein